MFIQMNNVKVLIAKPKMVHKDIQQIANMDTCRFQARCLYKHDLSQQTNPSWEVYEVNKEKQDC